MGNQSSMMFCFNKRDLYRLCNLLNKAAVDEKNGFEAWGVDPFAVFRLKKDLRWSRPWITHPIERFIPEGTYCVWWGGERGAQRNDNFLRYRARRGPDWVPYWDSYFIDYIPWEDLLVGIVEGFDKGTPGKIHENEWMRAFFPEDDNLISMDLIDQL